MTAVEAQATLDHHAEGWTVARLVDQPDCHRGVWWFALYGRGTRRVIAMHEDEIRDPSRCRAALAERIAA